MVRCAASNRVHAFIEIAAAAGRTILWPDRMAAMLVATGADGARRPCATPDRFVVQLDAQDLPGLLDLPVGPDSAMLNGNGKPFGAFDPRWSLYTGMMNLMILGAAFGIGANLCFALTGNTAGMFAGQIFMGGVWGVFAGLGIIVAQRLLPEAIATASAVFMSSTAIASALGGLTGGVGVGVLGLPHVFLAPALYGLAATAGIAIMSRSRHAVR
jgi:MFS family permease